MIFSKANFGTFSTSLVIQACGAGTGILTARLLGPVARGELATVILWPVILSNLGIDGLQLGSCAGSRKESRTRVRLGRRWSRGRTGYRRCYTFWLDIS